MINHHRHHAAAATKRSVACVALLLALLVAGGQPAAGDAAVGPLVRIGLVADNHYDTFPVGEKAPWQSLKSWFEEQRRRMTTTTKRRYDIAKDKLLEAVHVFNAAQGTTFVVNLGDLVNNDLMWNLRPILDAFNTVKAPHFSILGNHDLRAHNDRFGKNNKTQEKWIREKLGLGDRWYYSFSVSAFHFVFLDSMVLDEKNDPKREEHVAWIQAELASATSRGLAVIIFGHISVGLSTNALGPVIKACPHVVGAFFGHEHRGGYSKQGDVHTVILNGQIETLTNAFAVLDLFPDRMELTGFGRVPTRVMPFTNADTVAMVAATLAKQGEMRYAADHDLSKVGYTPLPPAKLWGPGDGQERMPPLQLDIPTYRKPALFAADVNPGQTLFAAEYRRWPRRLLTHAPEDPVDLADGTGKKGGSWLRYPLETARRAADQPSQLKSEHASSTRPTAPRTVAFSHLPRTEATGVESIPTLLPGVVACTAMITVGAVLLLIIRKRRVKRVPGQH
jgi:predicted phosphodiesterase